MSWVNPDVNLPQILEYRLDGPTDGIILLEVELGTVGKAGTLRMKSTTINQMAAHWRVGQNKIADIAFYDALVAMSGGQAVAPPPYLNEEKVGRTVLYIPIGNHGRVADACRRWMDRHYRHLQKLS